MSDKQAIQWNFFSEIRFHVQFGGKKILKYESSWAFLEAGNCRIGLHQMGDKYWNESKGTFKY